ncbi:uncharacterized protein LOC141857526 [Brevipalpus obovatus]|uniref:uncharacterized protein LOC141857526 n=1 Tax=Brevipalpus obovatus TaxID=246614 RepID=UPI003D9F7B30
MLLLDRPTVLFILLFVFDFVGCSRIIRTKLNPGCKETYACRRIIDSVNLVHSTSQEDDLTLNFLSTTVYNYPELLIFPDKEVTIEWENLLKNRNLKTLSLSKPPKNAIGILLKEWPTPQNIKYKEKEWTRLWTNCIARECITETESFFDDQRSIMMQTHISSEQFNTENLLIGPYSMLIKIVLKNFKRSEISKEVFSLDLFNFDRQHIDLDRLDEYERMQLKDEEESFFANSSFFQWMTSASAIKDGVEIRKIHFHDADITTSSFSKYYRLSSGIFPNGTPLRSMKISFDDPDTDVNFVDETYDSVTWSFVIGLGQVPEVLSPQPSSSELISRSTLIGLSGAALFVLIVAAIIGGLIIVQRKKSSSLPNISYKYMVSGTELLVD